MVFKKLSDVGSQHSSEVVLGEIQYKDAKVRLTNKHIILLDRNNQIQQVFENRNICNFTNTNSDWVYALNNRRIGYDNKLKKQAGGVLNAGLYVYDFSRLIDEGAIEVHKLSDALCGSNDFIDYDTVTQTVSFI